MNKNIQIKRKKHIKYLEKTRLFFKSKLEKMEIAYNNNEAKNCYQEVNTVNIGYNGSSRGV
jgi:hypothetical protein